MEVQYLDFVNTLKQFIVNLGTWCPEYEGIFKFMKVFDKLDIAKVIARYNAVMKKNSTKLLNMDNDLISNTEFNVIPGINLMKCWVKLDDSQKSVLWEQLQHMYVCSSYIMEQSTGSVLTPEEKQCLSDIEKSLHDKYSQRFAEEQSQNQNGFNPYEGVGSDDNFGVNTLLSGPKTLPGESTNNSGGFASFLNMKNMLNVDELTKQLQNISKDDIEQATDSIKKLLGSDVDDQTTDILNNLLTNITDELKSEKIKEGDPIANIIGIADTVAKKLGPDIKKQNIDVTQLMNTTKNLASKCKDNKGNNVFGKNDPFLMMGQLFENQMKMHDNIRKNGNKNQSQANQTMNMGDIEKQKDECFKDCQEMFATMGLGNINEKDLQNLDMSQLMKQLSTPPPQNNASK